MTSFKATCSDGHGRWGLVRGRKKGKKRERESSQDEPPLEKGERQLKSAKIEIVSYREEKSRFLKERREREEEEKRKRRK